mmetsp:Transcript_52671/g.160100  ORF Transcript_52671/g.160100 Transcript_52671/m.160100 type:complete len:222 (+) Transcript_52671:1218-1883(+)
MLARPRLAVEGGMLPGPLHRVLKGHKVALQVPQDPPATDRHLHDVADLTQGTPREARDAAPQELVRASVAPARQTDVVALEGYDVLCELGPERLGVHVLVAASVHEASRHAHDRHRVLPPLLPHDPQPRRALAQAANALGVDPRHRIDAAGVGWHTCRQRDGLRGVLAQAPEDHAPTWLHLVSVQALHCPQHLVGPKGQVLPAGLARLRLRPPRRREALRT